jgi:DNA ligase (NAD+)
LALAIEDHVPLAHDIMDKAKGLAYPDELIEGPIALSWEQEGWGVDALEWDHLLAFLHRLTPRTRQRLGERELQNLLEAIEASKAQPFEKVLYAVGIRHVGSETAVLLAQRFLSLDALRQASEEDIHAIHGVGAEIARSVREFFADSAAQALMQSLEKAGVQLVMDAKNAAAAAGTALAGLTFVITGTHPVPREELADLVRKQGGKITGSVSKKTNVLLAGEKAGSKLSKAQELDIEIWDHNALMAAIEKDGK